MKSRKKKATTLSTEELIQKVEDSEKGTASAVTISSDNNKAYQITIKKEGGSPRGTSYYIDQYTGEIKGDGKGATSDFFMVMFKLHRWLLLDSSIGRPIVGVATLIFVLMLISGLLIWFPAKVKNWKQGLKIKTKANWKRINYDLHNALGFYAFILMLVMALTGLNWSFEWYKEGLGNLIGAKIFSREKLELHSTISSRERALPIMDLIAISNEVLPYEGDYRISLPKDSLDVVILSKNKVGFFALSSLDKIILDQYSGEVLKKEIFAEKAFNEQLASSIRPLHMGDIFGTFSKILYFISCLIATSLPITGTIIWINKLKKKKKQSRR